MRVLRVYSLTSTMRSSLALFTALVIAPLAAFSADKSGGTVLVKEGQWVFEYYDNGKLVSEPINLKF